jgi:CheY-like chemotaxis protein
MLDLGVDATILSTSLTLVIAQRLVRRVCKECREQYEPGADVRMRVGMVGDSVPVYRGRGCTACGSTGFSGRVGIYEMFRPTNAIRRLINDRASETDLRYAARQAGMALLREDALRKVEAGLTSPDEVLRVVQVDETEVPCPNCNALIEGDFSTCPYCRLSLKNTCPGCGQAQRLEWQVCPYCNTNAGVQPPAEGLRTESGRTNEQEKAAPAPAPVEPAVDPETGQRRLRVLVVDDDADVRMIVSATLRNLSVPVEVVQAEDGVDAIEKATAVTPDLVVLDVMMPRMDGFETCRRLRENVRTAFVPILMLTAGVDQDSRTKAYLIGTDDYMAKPFLPVDLKMRVTRLLRRTYGI